MTTVHESVRGLVRALFADGGGGRCVMLMAARRGEGVSTLARALGETAAARAQRAVMLVDLDLLRDSHYSAYLQAGRFGGPGLGAGVPATLAKRCFFTPDTAHAGFTAHRVGTSKLLVTHFDKRRMHAAGAIRITADTAYWQAARRAADVTLVDAPALERSRIGLTVAGAMDAVVIVASGRAGTASATMELKEELSQRGLPILGVVYTDADPTVLAIEKALSE